MFSLYNKEAHGQKCMKSFIFQHRWLCTSPAYGTVHKRSILMNLWVVHRWVFSPLSLSWCLRHAQGQMTGSEGITASQSGPSLNQGSSLNYLFSLFLIYIVSVDLISLQMLKPPKKKIHNFPQLCGARRHGKWCLQEY